MLETCAEVLRGAYGIAADCVREVRGGWSARAFYADSPQGEFFVKVYDTQQSSVAPWIARIDDYMPVLVWLSRHSPLRENVPYPVLTPPGRHKWEDERYVYIVFAYIKGITVGTRRPYTPGQVEELARAVARLHGLGGGLPCCTPRLQEDNSLSFCDTIVKKLDDILPGPLAELISPYRATLRAAAARTLKLRDTVRANAARTGLCHTDLHGNNLMQADRLILVDWEDVCLAPPEADLFMFAKEPYWDAFCAAYREERPGYSPNEELLAFYLLRRRMSDIWYYTSRFLDDNPAEKEAAVILDRLKGQFLDTEALIHLHIV